MDTWDEWHSTVIGYCEGISLLFARQEKPDNVKKMLAGEWWYYGFGYVMGVFTWIGIILGLIKYLGG